MNDLHLIILLLVPPLLSFGLAFWLIPYHKDMLVDRGYIAKDMYKIRKRPIADRGGLLILLYAFVAYFISLSLIFTLRFLGVPTPSGLPIEFLALGIELLFILTVLIYSLFGFLDDEFNIPQRVKLFVPILFSLPLAIAIFPDTFHHPFGSISLGQVETMFSDGVALVTLGALVLIPIYIMVVANLVNMHSGFNGLQSGCSFLLLVTILVKGLVTNNLYIIFIATVVGSLAAYLIFNRYPATIFEGNVGAMALGSIIGCGIVVNHFFISGFVMMIPHVVNFLRYVYYRITIWLHPESTRYKVMKFSGQWKDGTIHVKNPVTLKWILPSRYRVDERQTVTYMWLITFIFCAISVFIPY